MDNDLDEPRNWYVRTQIGNLPVQWVPVTRQLAEIYYRDNMQVRCIDGTTELEGPHV